MSSDSISFSLRPKARLLRTIGDELISSEIVAVIELVKNAYDADATNVFVRFIEPLKSGEGGIEIIDNGNGMSLKIIEKSWMEPATSSKKHTKFSKIFRRRFLGEKGVGRFATSKLSDYLEIVTRYIESDSEIRAIFDWKQFDDEEKYLDQVEVLWDETGPDEISPMGPIKLLQDFFKISTSDTITHGTILRMSDLRANWDRSQLLLLRTALSRLISPFSEAQDFQVFLDLPKQYEDLSDKVETPKVFEKPAYRISGKVNSEGNANLILNVKGEAPQDISEVLMKDKNMPQCGPFEVDIRVWDLDSDSLKLLVQDQQSTLRNIRRDIKDIAGINIYRDQFRVLPYGERNNDWLRLDIRRVQNPTLRLSNNQIVGYILISSDDNPELRDQSNREGIVESQALRDLRFLVKAILAKLEAARYNTRRQQEQEPPSTSQGSLFGSFNLEPLRTALTKKYGKEKELIGIIDVQEKQLVKQVKVVQEVLSRYQRLASLGQIIDTILHDGRAPLSKIKNEATLLIRNIEKSGNKDSLFSKFIDKANSIKRNSSLLGDLFRKIEPFGGRKRGRPKKVILEEIISDACSVLESELHKSNIEIHLPEPKTTVFVEPTELKLVIMNLVDNSIYWLNTVEESKRNINISVLEKQNSSDGIDIIYSDTGPGVEEKFREQIFDPYFSTKPDGVGLGLAIAGEILTEYYSGSLELVENNSVSGVTFRIHLNKRV